MISTFDWTNDAVQRIFRVPVGFMRSKTQERIEELARERRAEASGEGGSIDLALVEEGIEIGKKMMAEMIATYNAPPPAGAKPAAATTPAPAGAASGERLSQRGEISLTPNSQLPIPKGARRVQSLSVAPTLLGVGSWDLGS